MLLLDNTTMTKKFSKVLASLFLLASVSVPSFSAINTLNTLISSGLDIQSYDLTLPAPVMTEIPSFSEKAYTNGTLVVEPDNSRTPVLTLIGSAKKSIDITIYTISDNQILNALVDAQKRGVAVRMIYNYNSFAARHIFPNDKAANQITAAGGQVKKAGSQYTITHQKTITVDGTTSLIMTFNLSASYFSNARDFGYITINPAQVSEIERVFNADWTDTPVTPEENTLVWSPTNSRTKILDLINNAQHTLVVDNEETADKDCINALISAAKRGVSVRFLTAILSNSNADSTSAGGNDANAAARDMLNKAGVQAKGASNHYMHGKMILADYGTQQQKAFIGSENFSYTSLNKNRELGIILTDKQTLTTLSNTFETDWTESH